ncbi:MAG: PRD domain-containing protein [Niameybacter sp.]|uniref:PRD domain-containing protein n=1 Tax=Niameybacter sp. TaxID=2033640 RepID=UPI002FC7D4C8
MEYQIIKVFNNNVVLASQEQDQVILVSKGIGFGKKIGDTIQENTNIEKVFHELSPDAERLDLKGMNAFNLKIKTLTHKIIQIAEENLGSLNENSEKMLKEHIEFAIERLGMGLTIENPFTREIITLYKKEFEIAGIARKYIEETIGIDIGEEEQGFIALHLRSARKNKSVNEIMRMTRVYKDCLQVVEQELKVDINIEERVKEEFLKMLRFYIEQGSKDVEMKLKKEVGKQLKPTYKVAQLIGKYLEKECHITLGEGLIAYMAVDIQKLISLQTI